MSSSKFSPRARELPSLIYLFVCFLHGWTMLDVMANKLHMLCALTVYKMAEETIVIRQGDMSSDNWFLGKPKTIKS